MPGKTIKLDELARIFKVKPETIRSWLKEGMPKKSGGGHGKPLIFDRDACLAWAAQHEKASVSQVTGVSAPKKPRESAVVVDYEQERALLMKVQRQLGQDKRRIIRGRYLRKEHVIEEIHACIAFFSTGLQKLDELIDGPQELKDQVREKVHQQLTKLANDLEGIPAKLAKKQHTRFVNKIDKEGKPVAGQTDR